MRSIQEFRERGMRKTNAYKPHCCFCSPEPISSLFHSPVHFTSTYLSCSGLIKLAMPQLTPLPCSPDLESWQFSSFHYPGTASCCLRMKIPAVLMTQELDAVVKACWPRQAAPSRPSHSQRPHSLKHPSTQRPSFLLLLFILCRLVPYFPS